MLATAYYFDTMNRLTKVKSPAAGGPEMTVAYDKQDWVTSRTDLDGKTTAFYFDFQGWLTKQSDAVGGCV